MTTLDVDGFEIDIETLAVAVSLSNPYRKFARVDIIAAVVKALSQDSKKRFEEYQERNDPCK